MVYMKACQRCRGDLRKSGDLYGPYLQCVQCGGIVDLPDERLAKAAVAKSLVRLSGGASAQRPAA